MSFSFATATNIVFGAGVFGRTAEWVRSLGHRVLVVTGSRPQRGALLASTLTGDGRHAECFPVEGEPTIERVTVGLAKARDMRADVVVALGGGSVVDAGKAIAALLTNGGEPLDYLEGIGHGLPITRRAAPFVAIPTTAGTGAEVTRNAVLASPEHRVKVSMRSELMLPRLALVDPELTRSMPPDLTAATGLDALTQLMEGFVTPRANPLTDGLCREGLHCVARSLRVAYHTGDDAEARTDMALASLFSGLVLANAGLGAVHGLAGPLGGLFPAPHGALCARLLPRVMVANMEALASSSRYDEVARILTDQDDAVAADGVAWVAELCGEMAIPPLAAYGVAVADFPEVVAKAEVASSMKGNPVKLSRNMLEQILLQAL